MRLQILSLLALSYRLCSAFADTSPFFLFSTSKLQLPTRPIESSSSITNKVSEALRQCPSNFYIFVRASGLRHGVFQYGQSAPAIHRFMTGDDKSIRSTASVNEVIGNIDDRRWQDVLHEYCGIEKENNDVELSSGVPQLQGHNQQILSINLDRKAGRTSAEVLGDADAMIDAYIDLLPSNNFTVLFVATPLGIEIQRPQDKEKLSFDVSGEFQDLLHMDLRRDVATHEGKKIGNQTIMEGPLFVKYQFFSPGLFMGFFVGILLLSILYVGVSGVASLTVSYAAFDKEMGPAAQKKQQ